MVGGRAPHAAGNGYGGSACPAARPAYAGPPCFGARPANAARSSARAQTAAVGTQRADPLAVAGLVVAVISVPLFFAFVPSVISLLLATVAAVRIRRSPQTRRGVGMVIASIAVASATLVGGAAFDALAGSTSNNINQPIYGARAPAGGPSPTQSADAPPRLDGSSW